MAKIEKKDCGWKITIDDKVLYVGEFCGEGVIYKDSEAFKKKEGVCYINEYGFDNSDENEYELFEFSTKEEIASSLNENNSYIATDGYTYQSILEIAEGDESLAANLFESALWAAIETYLAEIDNTED